MDILEKIVAAKRKEIEKYKPLSSIERFRKEGFFWETKPFFETKFIGRRQYWYHCGVQTEKPQQGLV